jgi:hypothetical protein
VCSSKIDSASSVMCLLVHNGFLYAGLASGSILMISQKGKISEFAVHPKRVLCLAAFGPWIVSGSWDKTIGVWSSEGVPVATLEGHKDAVNAICATDSLWSGGEDSQVIKWNSDAIGAAGKKGMKVEIREPKPEAKNEADAKANAKANATANADEVKLERVEGEEKQEKKHKNPFEQLKKVIYAQHEKHGHTKAAKKEDKVRKHEKHEVEHEKTEKIHRSKEKEENNEKPKDDKNEKHEKHEKREKSLRPKEKNDRLGKSDKSGESKEEIDRKGSKSNERE